MSIMPPSPTQILDQLHKADTALTTAAYDLDKLAEYIENFGPYLVGDSTLDDLGILTRIKTYYQNADTLRAYRTSFGPLIEHLERITS